MKEKLLWRKSQVKQNPTFISEHVLKTIDKICYSNFVFENETIFLPTWQVGIIYVDKEFKHKKSESNQDFGN